VAIVQRDALLEQAIEACDLPALILEKYPDCIVHRGAYQHANRAMFVAVWRNEKSPSVSCTFKGGRWLWHDFGNHDGGNAFTFLTRVCGLTPAQAAQELLERAGIANTAHTGSRVAENERDRQLRASKREHRNADQDFFDDWVEIRGTGWVEIGTPVGRAAMEFAATAIVPDLPGELIAHHRLGLDVPLEHPPFGPANLEALGVWIAECLRPAFDPVPTLATVATAELWQSASATKDSLWSTLGWNSGTLATRPRGW
jgi:hypothetical protein